QLLQREKVIGAAPPPFWTGQYLLHGTLDAGAAGDLTVRLHLNRVGVENEKTLTVSGSVDELPTLVNDLALAVVRRTRGDTKLATWDVQAEAARFAAEAAWGEACGQDWRTVQSAADAAWVLGHRDRPLTVLRVRSLLREACNQRYDIGASNYVAHDD